MTCKKCSEIQGLVEADVFAKELLPTCVESFEDFGYFGDDLDSYRLRKCPECKEYFEQHDWDHFEEGGAVGSSIRRIGKTEAAVLLQKVVEKIESAQWLKDRYDLQKIKAELARLQSDSA